MELNTMKLNNFMKLLMNSLKSKKNWFLISTVIIFVTTLLIPYILKSTEEFFIAFGIVEIFIIVFLNCLIDNSFFHSDAKLAYYKSKPISFGKQISISIVSNVIFTCFLIILLSLSMAFHDASYEFVQSFKFLVPWLAIGIFLSALSSILTGNTIMAGIMTIFNFSLPALFYLIIMFVFTILEDIVVGFSANVLMDTLTNTFYKLEYIYFYEYIDKQIDFIYVLLFGAILIILSVSINICIKRRKNENTGDFIVFDGFKYFVSVLASIIIPATFSMLLYEEGVASKIIVAIVLSILTYYIIIAVLEKSFRISKFSIKLFVCCMTIFIALTGGTILFANQFKNDIPNPEDVKMAYVGNDTWVFNNYINSRSDYKNEEYEDFMKWARKNNITIFTDKESIKYVTDLHSEMLFDQTYNVGDDYYVNNVIISYWMNDGSVIIRDYKFKKGETETGNKRKDDIANKLINSKELKEKRYYYLYDESYYNVKNIYCNIRNANDDNIVIKNLNFDNIRANLIKDIDKILLESKNPFELLFFHGDFYPYFKDEKGNENYYVEFIEKGIGVDDYIIDEILINDDFLNTMEFLQLND